MKHPTLGSVLQLIPATGLITATVDVDGKETHHTAPLIAYAVVISWKSSPDSLDPDSYETTVQPVALWDGYPETAEGIRDLLGRSGTTVTVEVTP